MRTVPRSAQEMDMCVSVQRERLKESRAMLCPWNGPYANGRRAPTSRSDMICWRDQIDLDGRSR